MAVVNESLVVPETPAMNWGITPRKHKAADFMLFWIFGGLSAFLSLGFILPGVASAHLGPEVTVGMVSLGTAIPMALFALIVIIHGLAQPAEEASREASIQASVWQTHVLRPYLEKRYGIRFDSRFDILGYTNGYRPRVTYQGRNMEVKIDGVEVYRNLFKFSSISHPYYVVHPELIRVSEVVEPTTVSYKVLPVIAD